MKSINKKLTLSALALACCLSAGVMSLQSTTAEDTMADTYEGFNMVNGAAVYLGNKDEFSGIRWTTKVTDELYELINSKSKGSFGVIVAPTESIETELTHNTKDVIDLSTGKDIKKVDGVYTYYSAIDFNDIVAQYEAEQGDLTEDQEAALLQQAYDMKLTARAYITTGSRYWYADMTGVDTSRSAKQVAIAAELAGEIDEDYRGENATADDTAKAEKAANYYGKTNDTHLNVSAKSNGAAGTKFVTADTAETVADYKTVAIDYTATGAIQEVFIGIEKLPTTAYNYADGTLTVTDVTGLPVGETYATVLTEGGAQAQPLIIATKVLDSTDDLSMFQTKGDRYEYSTKKAGWTDGKADESQIYRGYYVLGQTIDASSYVHGSRNSTTKTCEYTVTIKETAETGDLNGDGEIKNYKETRTGTYAEAYGEFNDATWNGAAALEGFDIGLMGTFNGLGYSISGMTLGSEREGFFGIVNGGTVKNVAIRDVKATIENNYVIANYLVAATIENVYITLNTRDANDLTNKPGYEFSSNTAIVASNAYSGTKLSNCYFRLNKQATATSGAALFGTYHSKQDFTCENVFMYVRSHYQYYQANVTTDETSGAETTTYALATNNYFFPMLVRTKAEVSEDKTEITTKGVIYFAQNQVVDPKAETLVPNSPKEIATEAYDFMIIPGLYAYGQNDTWSTEHDFSSFIATGCWEAGTRGVAWIDR